MHIAWSQNVQFIIAVLNLKQKFVFCCRVVVIVSVLSSRMRGVMRCLFWPVLSHITLQYTAEALNKHKAGSQSVLLLDAFSGCRRKLEIFRSHKVQSTLFFAACTAAVGKWLLRSIVSHRELWCRDVFYVTLIIDRVSILQFDYSHRNLIIWPWSSVVVLFCPISIIRVYYSTYGMHWYYIP